MESLTQFWESLTWGRIAFGSLLMAFSLVISYAAIMVVMIKLPANYFSSQHAADLKTDKPFMVRWGATIFKNLIGLLLVGVGVVMLVGPGPGLLTILLGLVMLDIPGKRPLEVSIIKRPTVLTAINNLRARYNRPPLIVD